MDNELERAAASLKQNADEVALMIEREKARATRFDEAPSAGSQWREVSKTVLELFRNFLVVCVISYGAAKSNSWLISPLAWIAQLAFMGLLASYFLDWVEKRARARTTVGRVKLAGDILFMVLAFIVLHSFIYVIGLSIDEMVRAQSQR